MTQMTQNEADAALEHYKAYRVDKDEVTMAATKEVCDVLRKHFPADRGNFDAPKVLANAITLFDLDNNAEVRHLYLEWVLERFVGLKIKKNLPDVELIVNALKQAGHTEENPFVWNDLDNKLFYIPDGTRLIFCSTSQNRRYIFIKEASRFHIRRYYDVYDINDDREYKQSEAARYNERGILEAIKNAEWLSNEWSDCTPGNLYPSRPSLQWFKDHDFSGRYNDGRDMGYVCTYECLSGPRVDWAIHNYTESSVAVSYIRCAVGLIDEILEGRG